MEDIDPDQYRRTLDLIESLYRLESMEAVGAALFEGLGPLIPHSCAIFLPIDPHSYEHRPGFYEGIAPELMLRYLHHYAPLDPFIRMSPCPDRLNCAVRLSDIAEAAGVYQTEFVDFMEQVPYHHALGTLAGVRGRPIAAFGLGRTRSDKDFSETDAHILGRIAPHIAQAIHLQETLDAGEAPAETGVVVFGPNGEILFENPVAARLLGTKETELVRALADGMTTRFDSPNGPLRLHWSSLTPPSVLGGFGTPEARTTYHRLRQNGPNTAGSGTENGIRILTIEPFRQRRDLPRRLERYGLSPREMEVAVNILRGRANGAIAESLSIDETTVKAHLRHIFDKVGVHNRNGLIAKVMGWDQGLSTGFAPVGSRAPRSRPE